MTRPLPLSALVLPLLLLSTTASAEKRSVELAHKLIKKVEQRNKGWTDMQATIDMKLEDDSGKTTERQLRVRALEGNGKEGGHSLLIFDAPADVRGTALLSRAGGQQYLYLPSVRRARRVAGGKRTGAVAGSEFTYEDIGGLDADEHDWVLLKNEACRGDKVCFRLKSTPKSGDSSYGHRIVWVEKSSLEPEKIEFFDKKGQPLKVLTYADYTEVEGQRRARKWTMQNQQSGHVTRLTFSNYAFKNGFTDRDFSKSALKRIR